MRRTCTMKLVLSWILLGYVTNAVYSTQVFSLTDLGCWKDRGAARTVTALADATEYLGTAPYKKRDKAIQRCAAGAYSKGYSVICMQDGGNCRSDATAKSNYNKYGASTDCLADGKGGPWANQCYEIGFNMSDLGCWTDSTATRNVPTLENTSPLLVGDYKKRKDALQKCATVSNSKDFNVFCVQNGGWCASSPTAESTYKKLGPSTACNTAGTGGGDANQCYKIVQNNAKATLNTCASSSGQKMTVFLNSTLNCTVLSSITLSSNCTAATCMSTTPVPSTTAQLTTTTATATTTMATTTATKTTTTKTTTTVSTTELPKCASTCSSDGKCDLTLKPPKCVCNKGFKGNGITCTAYCKPTSFVVLGHHIFSFNETWSGITVYSNERCPGNGRSIASIQCVTNSTKATYFDKTTFFSVNCNLTVTAVVDSIIKPMQSNKTVVLSPKEVDDTSAQLQLMTSKSLTKHETTSTVLAVETLSNQKIDNKAANNLLQTVSNVITQEHNLPKDKKNLKGNENTTLLHSLDVLAQKTPVPVDKEYVEIVAPSLSMQIHKPKNTSNLTAMVFRSADKKLETVNGSTVYTVKTANVITVSEDFIKEVTEQAHLSGNLFSNDFRFYCHHHKVNSLFGDVQNMAPVSTFGASSNGRPLNFTPSVPIDIQFHSVDKKNESEICKDNPRKQTLTKMECRSWNSGDQGWETVEGGFVREGSVTQCKVKSLGSFSMLVSSIVVPSNVALGIVSQIGCILSIIGLLLTMIIYTVVKDLRTRKPTPIMMNICGCLVIAYLLFVFGVSKTKDYTTCTVITILLHFFLLSAWSWMFANSINMYLSLVKVFAKGSGRSIPAYIAAYGVPLLIVLATTCTTMLYFDKQSDQTDLFFESSYRYRNMCWIRSMSLYISFLLPVGIVLLCNILLFGAILSSVLGRENWCAREHTRYWEALNCVEWIASCFSSPVKHLFFRKCIQSTAKQMTTLNELLVAISMVAMMGLTWVFAYLMLVSTDVKYVEVMSWVFTILNTTQGILIFIMMCVRHPALWLDPVVRFVTCGHFCKKTKPNRSKYVGTNTTNM